MDSNSWKKILSVISDERLISLANKIEIKVPGFRKVTPQLLKNFKIKLIKEMIKPRYLIKISNELNGLYNDILNKNSKNYREMDEADLIKQADNKDKFDDIVLSLFSSKNIGHKQLAMKISNGSSSRETSNLRMEDKIKDTMHKENQTISFLRDTIKRYELETKVKENKINDLNSKFDSLNQKFIKYKKQQNQLKILMSSKLEKRNDDLENKTKQIEELKRDNDKLKELLRISEKKFSDKKRTYRVAIIGNPQNSHIVDDSITIYEEDQLQDLIKSNKLSRFDELWILRYRVSTEYIKKCLDLIKTVKIVNNFKELKKLHSFLKEKAL
ncbi:hypothetical protein [Sporolactobacillus terrae]|uniref:hypothetical protein n=1 Tax=Sporolactobacillus terrae TaxID=269673 RepID=UPI000490B6DE|nr:hypothetical protein [Sporolactobacillus terrae]